MEIVNSSHIFPFWENQLKIIIIRFELSFLLNHSDGNTAQVMQ